METIVHFFNELMVALNWVAKNVPWDAVAASGILSGVLIGPQRAIKKWFDHHEQVIIALIGIVGPVTVAVYSYILHHYGTDPRIVLLQGLALSFGTQPFYFIVWKPWVIGRLVPRFAKWVALQVAEAELLNQGKVVQEIAPLPKQTQVSIPIEDFKS